MKNEKTKEEKFLLSSLKVSSILIILLFIASGIAAIMQQNGMMDNKEEFIMDWGAFWTSILTGIVSSAITSVLVCVIAYFKFLRKIPEETKRSIDELLNARLDYETENHNAEIEKSDSIRQELSYEHDKLSHEHERISDRIESVQLETVRRNSEKQQLTGDTLSAVEAVNKLSLFAEIVASQNNECRELKGEILEKNEYIHNLEQQIDVLEEKLEHSPKHKQHYERDEPSI